MSTAVNPGFILLVEDNQTNLAVLSDALRSVGLSFRIAPDGESALEQVAWEQPELILLDIRMPGIDGFETCRRLKANPETCHIPVIFTTALTDADSKATGFALGAIDYISKPFDRAEVLARLQVHLQLKQLKESLEEQVRDRTLALQQKEAQYRSIFEAINDGIFISELETGKIVAVNPATCEMHGYTEAAFIKLSPPEYIHPSSLPKFADFLEAIKAGNRFFCEAVDIHKDGTLIDIEVTGVPFLYNHQPHVLALVRDISEKKRLEAERRQAEAELRKQEQLLRSMYEGVEHSICIVDVSEVGEFRFVGWNPATEKITGIASADIVGKTPEELLGQDQGTIVRQNYQRCLEAGNTITYEECVPFQGRDIWWLTTLNPLRDEHDRIYRIVITTFDISDRKQAEAALAESEANHRSLFDQSAIGLALCRMDGQLVYVNTAYANIIGRTPEEVFSLTYWQITPEKYAEQEQQQLHSLQTLGCYGPYEKEYIHKDGSLVPVRLSGVVIEQRGEQFIWSSVENIRGRKAAEIALQQKEAQYRAIFESINDGIVISDLETGTIVTVNPAVCQMFGYTPEEFCQLTPPDYVHPNSLPKFADFLTTVRAGHPFSCEAIDIRKDGTLIDVDVKAVPFLYDSKPHALALLRDISENKQLEADRKAAFLENTRLYAEEREKSQQLQERNQLLAFQSITSHIAACNEELPVMLQQFCQAAVDHLQAAFARIWLLNPAENMLELKASAGLYTHINGGHQFVPVGKFKIGLIAAEKTPHLTNNVPNDPRVGNPEWARQEGMISFAGHPLIMGNQLLGVVAMFARIPLSESTLASLEVAAMEISLGVQRKLLETSVKQKALSLEQTLQELQRTQMQMIQTEKMSSLGQLVAGVAHEINNPVSFIHGNVVHISTYAQDLLGLINLYQQTYPQPNSAIANKIENIDLEFLSKDLPNLLNSMTTGTQRIRDIVQSLRNFSRLDEAEFKAVNIHEGIDSTLMVLQHRLKADLIRPEIQIIKCYGLLPLVECFAGELNQVFMNIIVNAIDVLEEQDKKRSLEDIKQDPSKITITTELQAEKQVVIQITDNGPGISESIRQQLFNPFFTTKPVGQGTGMGLSISYQIITERHNGKLYCRSTPGQGAEFVIKIPVRQG